MIDKILLIAMILLFFVLCSCDTGEKDFGRLPRKAMEEVNSIEALSLLKKAKDQAHVKGEGEIRIVSKFRNLVPPREEIEIKIEDEFVTKGTAESFIITWQRKLGTTASNSVFSRMLRYTGLQRTELKIGNELKGMLKCQNDLCDLQIAGLSGNISSDSYSSLKLGLRALEEKTSHRLLLLKLLTEKELPFQPDIEDITFFGNEACGQASEECFVVRWKTKYFGDQLYYRASIGKNDFRFRKIEEEFLYEGGYYILTEETE